MATVLSHGPGICGRTMMHADRIAVYFGAFIEGTILVVFAAYTGIFVSRSHYGLTPPGVRPALHTAGSGDCPCCAVLGGRMQLVPRKADLPRRAELRPAGSGVALRYRMGAEAGIQLPATAGFHCLCGPSLDLS
jgi:hypothetical protein